MLTVKPNYIGLMAVACLPLGPVVISNDTFWFSFGDLKPLPSIAEKCANKSSPPPFSVLDNYGTKRRIVLTNVGPSPNL